VWWRIREAVLIFEKVFGKAGFSPTVPRHAAARTDIRASKDFSISLSFSTQLQHHQTITNIDAVYIIVSASASSIQ
jgi:hypothetical protein